MADETSTSVEETKPVETPVIETPTPASKSKAKAKVTAVEPTKETPVDEVKPEAPVTVKKTKIIVM